MHTQDSYKMFGHQNDDSHHGSVVLDIMPPHYVDSDLHKSTDTPPRSPNTNFGTGKFHFFLVVLRI